MVKHINYYNAFLLLSLLSTLLASFFLSSSLVSANDDSVIDDINITVPSACTMIGTGMNSHNATINNGTYATDIGTTTIKAFCNDSDGFAIYAIGYTDDTDGKNVMTSDLGADYNIQTGTGTSGNSQWAMKLATNPEATYPLTLQNGYGSYHIVPDDFELVAKRTSNTDIGQGAVGSILTSTYQVFISNNQPAGTYIGQVKYVMVHPNTAPEPIHDDQFEVIYDGNGLTFPGGATTNRVVYGESCIEEGIYVGNTATISKTTNIANDGTMNSYNSSNSVVQDTVTISGADGLKIELTYGYDENGGMYVFTGVPEEYENIEDYEGDDTFYDYFWSEDWEFNGEKTTSVEFTLDSDTVTFLITRWDEPTVNYYGYYAKVYPVYNEETEGTTYEVLSETCNIVPQSGAYAETDPWNGYWYYYYEEYGYSTTLDHEIEEGLYDYGSVTGFLKENKDDLIGTTVVLKAYHPYIVNYDGNGATDGTMNGFNTVFSDTNDAWALLAPNFKKNGFGFAGWSTNQNATVNGDDTILGPSESIRGDELFLNNNYEVTLYAVWVPVNGAMQSFNCSSLSPGQITALSDIRDSNVYTVGKMQDGKCWMMENLRLDSDNSLDDTKAQGYSENFIGLANSEDQNFSLNNTTANSLYNTSNIVGSNQAHRFPRYNNNHIKIGGTNASGKTLVPRPDYDIPSFDQINEPTQWYSYGNYYTWAAAIADTSNYTSVTDVATTSICPSGWHLPTASESDTLFEAFGGVGSQSTTNEEILQMYTSFPNNFLYSGYYASDRAQQYGDDLGLYWLATNASSEFAYRLYLQRSPFVFPSSNNARKTNGYTIRCIAD